MGALLPTPGVQAAPPTPGLEAPPKPRLLVGMERIQGAELPTFAPPELEGSMDVCAIIDSHLRHSPEQPFLVWSGSDGQDCELKVKDWVPAIYHAARLIGRVFGVDLDAGGRFELDKRPIVAMLTAAEHQRYYTMGELCAATGPATNQLKRRSCSLGRHPRRRHRLSDRQRQLCAGHREPAARAQCRGHHCRC